MSFVPHYEKSSPSGSSLAASVSVYHAKLQNSPSVLTDLVALGVDLEAVEYFRLGYCEVGRFAGRVTIPVCNEFGHVVQLAGWLPKQAKHDEAPSVLYLPTAMSGVFNASGLRGAREIVLCESISDALRLWCSGVRSVTATFGLSGLTDEMLACFKRLEVKRVVLSFEADAYGLAAMASHSSRLTGAGFECLERAGA